MDGIKSVSSLNSQKQIQQNIAWIIFLLGIWNILFPFTFSYDLFAAIPSGGRKLWLSNEERVLFMKWNDILIGLIIALSGLIFALKPCIKFLLWIVCMSGLWLTVAPLIFWSPTQAGYLNDTLIGAMLIALTSLSGKMPGLEMTGDISSTPDGWTYNPSEWSQRWPLMIGGFAGWMISRYLSAYQLGYISYAEDPFFGGSTMKVLNSSVSLSLPVSDGGVGAIAYTFEFLLGLMGGASRWKTKPWLVFLLGLIIIPVGFAHVFLVVSQPVVVGYWCTLCLLAATTMLIMITLGTDEIFAMIQFLIKKRKEGVSFANAFLKGDPLSDEPYNERNEREEHFFSYAVKGVSVSKYALILIISGIFIVALPAFFKMSSHMPVSYLTSLIGLLIIVFSVLSMSEIMKRIRYLNVLAGLFLAGFVWFTDAPFYYNIICLVSGIAVVALSFGKRFNKEKYGLWEKYL
jgi:hypothetical protein